MALGASGPDCLERKVSLHRGMKEHLASDTQVLVARQTDCHYCPLVPEDSQTDCFRHHSEPRGEIDSATLLARGDFVAGSPAADWGADNLAEDGPAAVVEETLPEAARSRAGLAASREPSIAFRNTDNQRLALDELHRRRGFADMCSGFESA